MLTHIASFGETCFQTYATIAEAIGGATHTESVGRAIRQLADEGFLEHTRVLPGETPANAKWPSGHGTTANRIRAAALGVKRLAKSARSELRDRAAQVLRGRVLAPTAALAVVASLSARTPSGSQPLQAPRYSAPTRLFFETKAATERAGRAPSPHELEERRKAAKRGLAELEERWANERAGPDPPD